MKSGVNFRVGGFVLQQIPVGAAFPQIRVSLLRHLAAAQGDGHACFFDLLHQAAQDFRRKPWTSPDASPGCGSRHGRGRSRVYDSSGVMRTGAGLGSYSLVRSKRIFDGRYSKTPGSPGYPHNFLFPENGFIRQAVVGREILGLQRVDQIPPVHWAPALE